jgi:hypothetical protein
VLETVVHSVIVATGRVLRVFKTRWFARDERIPDDSLSEAVARAGRGLIDAELGSGLI